MAKRPTKNPDSSLQREMMTARVRTAMVGRERYPVLALAILAALVVAAFPTPEGLTEAGQRAISILVLCIILWVTQAIPLVVTSLLAIILFPLLGVMESGEVYPFFANQAVFFILGAFILASAIMRSGLSSRVALHILRRFGRSPKSLLGSVMLIPAVLSFIMPEHAVAAMFFPVVVEITRTLRLRPGESRYAKGLFVSMAWGSVIGGIATFLGGARAPLALGILYATTGETISFMRWTLAAFPTVLVLLVVGYFVITRMFKPEIESVEAATESIGRKVDELGPLSRNEVKIGLLMTFTVLTWILFGEDLGLANIALAAVAIAFALGLMSWKDVEEDVNWGVIFMYGGAIALGFGLTETGASAWLVDLTVGSFPSNTLLIVAVIALLTHLLTEAISNTAVVAVVLPVGLTFALANGVSPEVMTLAVAIPAGLAYMLPMGTPANAIAFSSGHLEPRDTLRAGSLMLFVSWVTFVITAALWWPIIGFQL